ncbi:MAG: hypothetical protein ACFFHD_05295 [Promethearchaeota archaeon]
MLNMPISKKDAKIQADSIIKNVLKDHQFLSEVLKRVKAKEDTIRYPNAIALEFLSEKYSEIVYPEWDFLLDLLRSKNSYHKSIAISTIANLITADDKKKFNMIFNEFFNLLNDKSVMVARKVAIYSGRIAKAKPLLRPKITKILLQIDQTHHNPNRKDLIKGDIIESFSEYFIDIKEKEKILNFAKAQLKSTSPSTVKKANDFLEKWEQ